MLHKTMYLLLAGTLLLVSACVVTPPPRRVRVVGPRPVVVIRP